MFNNEFSEENNLKKNMERLFLEGKGGFREDTKSFELVKYCLGYLSQFKETNNVQFYYTSIGWDEELDLPKLQGITVPSIASALYPQYLFESDWGKKGILSVVKPLIHYVSTEKGFPLFHIKKIEGYVIPTVKEHFERVLIQLNEKKYKENKSLEMKINNCEIYREISPSQKEVVGLSKNEVLTEIFSKFKKYA